MPEALSVMITENSPIFSQRSPREKVGKNHHWLRTRPESYSDFGILSCCQNKSLTQRDKAELGLLHWPSVSSDDVPGTVPSDKDSVRHWQGFVPACTELPEKSGKQMRKPIIMYRWDLIGRNLVVLLDVLCLSDCWPTSLLKQFFWGPANTACL